MSKKQKKAPRLDPRVLIRPRLDALFDRRLRGELDQAGLLDGLAALLAEAGQRPVLGALLKRLETAASDERATFLAAAAAALNRPEAAAFLWQQVKQPGRPTPSHTAALHLLRALGEDADPDHPERYLPAAPPAPQKKAAPLVSSTRSPALERTPEQAAADARWEEFEAADLPGRIALFEAAASGVLDHDEAFEMLNLIREELDPARRPANRAQYAALVERLKREAPAAYQAEAHYLIPDVIADIAAEGRWGALPDLLKDLIPNAAKGADQFDLVIDRLMYHGQTRPLLEAMRAAWPQVSRSPELLPWAIDDFTARLILLLFYDYVETAAQPRADDPVLIKATRPYGELLADWAERAIRHLSAATPWTPDDFGEAVDAEQWQANLHGLLFEFMADQRRAGVPLTRLELARTPWYDALYEALSAPQAQGWKRKGSASPLTPDRQRLDKILAESFQLLSAHPHQVAGAIELLPAYLHFIARRGLLARLGLHAAFERLQPLARNGQALLDRYGEPALAAAVGAAWAEARLAGYVQDPAVPETIAEPDSAPGARAPAPRSGQRITYTFKVTYQRDPDIWRTVELTATQTLRDLHAIIQDVFDFDFDHLYSFFLSGKAWDKASEYAAQPEAGERGVGGVALHRLRLRLKQTFLYLFDYGDDHRFTVQLMSVNTDAPKGDYPRLVEAHGKSPEQYPAEGDDEDDTA
jgi:hypothetical protein